ncbi:hypothetical protein DL89DRAFT_68964 [Linderina pennispora]|uniref:Calponin-homology (CH) domain-containing protein n=1 Tax=Linderina pennispora TaxID=61395 RepID=A0A1Y1VZ56_9FUNG|nr:uncharacterized protein DL89DRAFT_68964 [Linderina pennispora]ORX66296.1 hypothetical protein DL89DRAFT_68964 [Linderina pennispora]
MNTTNPDDEVPIYGYDKELRDKLEAKYDVGREQQARAYIADAIGAPVDGEFMDALHDGTVLVHLANAVVPGRLKPNASRLAFKQMENINSFLTVAAELGCPSHELFQTVDLFEAKNPGQVVDAIFSFSRHAAKRGFRIPPLGPKLADKQHRQWTDKQLREGDKYQSPLQMGYSGGATQSTEKVVFGGHKSIVRNADPFHRYQG